MLSLHSVTPWSSKMKVTAAIVVIFLASGTQANPECSFFPDDYEFNFVLDTEMPNVKDLTEAAKTWQEVCDPESDKFWGHLAPGSPTVKSEGNKDYDIFETDTDNLGPEVLYGTNQTFSIDEKCAKAFHVFELTDHKLYFYFWDIGRIYKNDQGVAVLQNKVIDCKPSREVTPEFLDDICNKIIYSHWLKPQAYIACMINGGTKQECISSA